MGTDAQMLRAGLVALLIGGTAGLSHAQAGAIGEVDMSPHEPASFGLRNVAAGATAILGGWNYWYKERIVEVQTVPADAQVQLFFIRMNFQKRFERVEPPVRVRLPSRIETTSKDSFALRVAAAGYSTREMSIKVNDVPDRLVVKLEPLPNALVALTATLTFRTTKEPELGVMKSRGASGFTISLSETANQLPSDSKVAGGRVQGLEVAQVGEDLLVRVDTDGSDVEARSRQSYDPIRREHLFVVYLLKEGTRRPTQHQVRAELERIPLGTELRCALRFEEVLRSEIDPEVIARGLRPSGSVADLYRREAMLRLGRLDQGRVRRARAGAPVRLDGEGLHRTARRRCPHAAGARPGHALARRAGNGRRGVRPDLRAGRRRAPHLRRLTPFPGPPPRPRPRTLLTPRKVNRKCPPPVRSGRASGCGARGPRPSPRPSYWP
jgi:hypothetical protein